MKSNYIYIIRLLNVLFFVLFLCSLGLPWESSFQNLGINVIGFVTFYTVYIGIFFLVIFVILSFTKQLRLSFGFGAFALVFLSFGIPKIIILAIVSSISLYFSFGVFLYICSWIGFIITVSLIRSYCKKFLPPRTHKKSQAKDIKIKEYVKKLPSIYDQISFIDIIATLGLRNKDLSNLRMIVEDLIYNKEIEGKIVGNVIIFKKETDLDLYGIPTESSYSEGISEPPFSPSSPPSHSQVPSTSLPSNSSSSSPFSSVGSPAVHVTKKKTKSKSSKKIVIAIILVICFIIGASLIITGLNMLTSSNPNQGILFIGIGAVLAIPLAILVYDYIFGIENIF